VPPTSNVALPVAAAPADAGASVPEPAVRSTALVTSSPAATAEAAVLGNGAEHTPAENPPAARVPESASDHKVADVQLTMAEEVPARLCPQLIFPLVGAMFSAFRSCDSTGIRVPPRLPLQSHPALLSILHFSPPKFLNV